MSDQLSLDDVKSGPLARTSDPHTSHLAAAEQTIERVTPMRARVLLALYHSLHFEATDDWLIAEIGGSPSSIRTRRKELVDAGFVFGLGGGISHMGRPALIWSLAVEGYSFVRDNHQQLEELAGRKK